MAATKQYAVPLRLSFPASVDGVRVRAEVERLLSEPMVQGQLARLAQGARKLVGEYTRPGQLAAWVYFWVGSDAEAAATKTKLEAMLGEPIVKQVLAATLPQVTWRVGEPAAV